MNKIAVTDSVHLDLIAIEQAPALFDLVRTHRTFLAQWLIWPNYIKTQSDYEAFIHRSLDEYSKNQSAVYCVFYHDQPVGTAGFIDLQPNLAKGEIGYWLEPSVHGLGIATAVGKALVELGFHSLNLTKVEASVALENVQSQAVCERIGMKLEGVMANQERINGRIISHKKYAVLLHPNV